MQAQSSWVAGWLKTRRLSSAISHWQALTELPEADLADPCRLECEVASACAQPMPHTAAVVGRYNPKRDITFLPMSGLLGVNIVKSPEPKMCPWYKGPTLFQVLSSPGLRRCLAHAW